MNVRHGRNAPPIQSYSLNSAVPKSGRSRTRRERPKADSQLNWTDVRTFDRRRIAKPTIPKPATIIAQVAGSGTAAVAAEIVKVLFPELMLVRLKVPVLNTGLEFTKVNRSGPVNWVKPCGDPPMFSVAAKNVPKPTDAVCTEPPNVPGTTLYDTWSPMKLELTKSGTVVVSIVNVAVREPVSWNR